MKLLKVIRDSDLFPGYETENKCSQKRLAARAVIFDDENKTAMLNVTNLNYHKLPGGGVEEGEDLSQALKREIMEETGCNISVMGEIGKIIEYRDKFDLQQESDCYLAKSTGQKGTSNFDEGETRDGFAVIWVSLDEALDMLKKDNPDDYEGKFIILRDLCFLEEAKKIIAETK
jgi:8-oxo-dGTP pyrophosphatase MutT (NUDIX family)